MEHAANLRALADRIEDAAKDFDLLELPEGIAEAPANLRAAADQMEADARRIWELERAVLFAEVTPAFMLRVAERVRDRCVLQLAAQVHTQEAIRALEAIDLRALLDAEVKS